MANKTGERGRLDAGCLGAKKGDKVQLQYICRSEDGIELETTYGKAIPTIILGRGDVLKALEKALLGMKAGEKKTVLLHPNQAFGDYDEELLLEVPLEQWQWDEAPRVGLEIELLDVPDGTPDDQITEEDVLPGVVVEVCEGYAVVDCNHPLAGKTLIYDLELVKILTAKP